MRSKKPASWSNVEASLSSLDRSGLVGIIRDLYETSSSNRRFLHARFIPAAATLDEYRDLVGAAVFPDPLSQRPIRLRDAATAIADYKRSTGDLAGVVDLLLTFVEAGTEQAADLGYGDEPYFSTLERKVNEAVSILEGLPDEARAESVARVIQLGKYQNKIGWGYGDFLADVAAQVTRGKRRSARGASNGLRAEYTFDYSKAKPNRFAGRMVGDVVAVILEPDVASVVKSSAKANAMLRSVLAARPRKRSVRVRGHRRKAG